MHSALIPTAHRARPARGPLGLLALVLLAMLAAQLGVATAYAGTSAPAHPTVAASVQSPSQLKVVIIVGPTGTLTDQNLTDAESLAQAAESYGMDVHRIFYPNATWDAVVAAAQGANLLVYMGHGNGWPSPYAPFQEDTKNGIGVGPFANGSTGQTKYYGANVVRTDIKLAPNAIVFLNHLCYAAGNGETGMAVPTWDTAHQRNDNFAAGFLAAGARTVFAYSWQLYIKTLRDLMTTDKTIKDIFETPGAQPKAYYGWIGADARMFDSVRTPGTVNYLDRDPKDGFLRGVSGDLSMTAGQWRGEESTANLKNIAIPPVGPTIPQAFHGTAYNNRVVQLSWQPATAAQYGDMRYVVARNNKSVGSWTTGTTFTDQPSKAGTYTYQVRAIDPAGNKGQPSVTLTVTAADQVGATPPPTPTPTPTPTSTPTPTPTPTPSTSPTPTPTPSTSPTPTPTPTPASTPPTAPRNFGAVLGDANQVTLSWSASTAYVAGTVNYRVFRNGTAIGVKSPLLTYVDQPAPGASYTYKVRAIDSTGVTSAYSPSITVEVPGTTVTADTTPPSTPTGLTAVSLTSRQISLSWQPSTDDRLGTLWYRVFRDSTLITTVTDPWFIDAPGSAGTYTYTVKAVDAAGNKGAFSAAVRGYAFD